MNTNHYTDIEIMKEFKILIAAIIIFVVTVALIFYMGSCSVTSYTPTSMIEIKDYEVLDTIDIDETVILNHEDNNIYVVYMIDGKIINVISQLKHLNKK